MFKGIYDDEEHMVSTESTEEDELSYESAEENLSEKFQNTSSHQVKLLEEEGYLPSDRKESTSSAPANFSPNCADVSSIFAGADSLFTREALC